MSTNDYDLVQQLIPEAVNRYKQELRQKDIKVTIDNQNFLPDDSLVFDFIFQKLIFYYQR